MKLPTNNWGCCWLPWCLCAACCCSVPADMQWLLYELLWRDFFRFITKKYSTAGTPQRHTASTAAMAMAWALLVGQALAAWGRCDEPQHPSSRSVCCV